MPASRCPRWRALWARSLPSPPHPTRLFLRLLLFGSTAIQDSGSATSATSADCVDDMAFVYGIKVENNNHPPAVFHASDREASSRAARRLGLGSRTGLELRIRISPDLSCLARALRLSAGRAIWSNGYLPAAYQGTLFRTTTPIPVVDLKPQPA